MGRRLRAALERAGDPQAFVSTVTFVERGTTTEVTMRAVFATRERRDEVIENYGAIEGGKQTLGRLAALVAAVAAVAAGSQPGSSSGRW